jgi:hypothetical protein
MRVLGSGRVAAWLAPEGRQALLVRWGVLRMPPLPPAMQSQAAAIRAAQAEAARQLGLGFGGDLSSVSLLADGIHWNRAGVREAAHQAAKALAAALRQSPRDGD